MSPNRISAAWRNRPHLNQRRVRTYYISTKNYLAFLTDRTDLYSPLSSKPSLLASAELNAFSITTTERASMRLTYCDRCRYRGMRQNLAHPLRPENPRNSVVPLKPRPQSPARDFSFFFIHDRLHIYAAKDVPSSTTSLKKPAVGGFSDSQPSIPAPYTRQNCHSLATTFTA